MIVISAQARDGILAHAERAWPRECCGLLAGTAGADGAAHIRRAHPARNVDASGRADRFEIDPQARFDLMRALRGGPEKIVGHYHSHPNGAPEPSAADRAMAHEPDLIWLICAVKNAGANTTTGPAAGPVRAFRITGGPGADAETEHLDMQIEGDSA